MRWVKALHKWNKKIAELSPAKKMVKIIQGSKDATVDWKYNLDFIGKKFSEIDLSLIEDGRHELFNETEDIRNTVFSQITNYLEN